MSKPLDIPRGPEFVLVNYLGPEMAEWLIPKVGEVIRGHEVMAVEKLDELTYRVTLKSPCPAERIEIDLNKLLGSAAD